MEREGALEGVKRHYLDCSIKVLYQAEHGHWEYVA